MKVAIIGTGNMGVGLAAVFARSGVETTLAGRDVGKAATAAADIAANVASADIRSAAANADVVVLAVPFQALNATIDAIGPVDGKILVDISNPITADYRDLLVGHTTSAAEQLQALAPQAKVVKAFNTVFAQLLAPEARQATRLQVFVAGDDDAANETVSALVKAGGFEPVPSGPLCNCRFLEPIGEMNIHFGYFLGKGRAVAPAWISIA